MRRSVAIALAFALAEHGVVLIDEIEGGIHPRALKEVITHLLQAAVASDVQLLATTHSLEAIDAVLDAVNAIEVADIVGYHIRRDGQGHAVRRYGQEKLLLLREGGLDLR
jgi:AAA15 family ATPase/GTPase